MTVHIANTHAFWIDDRGAPTLMIAGADKLEYLSMDYLAEVTVTCSLASRPTTPTGATRRTSRTWWRASIKDTLDHDVAILANGGGVNPTAVATWGPGVTIKRPPRDTRTMSDSGSPSQ